MTPTASRVADRSAESSRAAGIRQPGEAPVSVHEAPATTHEAIERLVQAEVDRLPAGERLALGDSFASWGIDAVAFHDVVHRIESRYQMRFRPDWLEGIDCWNDLVQRIERHLVDRIDTERLTGPRRRGSRHSQQAGSAINLTSTDYLGLAWHPDVVTAAKEAIDCFGCSMPTGELAEPSAGVIDAFEEELAAFLGVERAVAMAPDHGPLSAVFGRLVGAGDLLLIDRDARAGIVRAAESSRAACRHFSVRDCRQLARLLGSEQGRSRRRVVVVEAISSATGAVLDLASLLRLKAMHDFLLVVDESDSLGTLGGGRGLAVHAGVDPRDVDLWIASQWRSLGEAAATSPAVILWCGIWRRPDTTVPEGSARPQRWRLPAEVSRSLRTTTGGWSRWPNGLTFSVSSLPTATSTSESQPSRTVRSSPCGSVDPTAAWKSPGRCLSEGCWPMSCRLSRQQGPKAGCGSGSPSLPTRS